MPLPPVPVNDKDADQLRTLGMFHFVLASLGLAGLAFLFVHYVIMSTAFSNPSIWNNMKDKNGNPVPMPFNPADFFHAFRWFYLFFGAWGVVSIVLNVIAGLELRRWRARTFLLLVGGLNCVNFPFGTVLGIFTIMVLMRDTVRLRYAAP